MGDLIMSGPAIRALKESFDAKITVLTSSMAKGVTKHIAEIDDVIIYDLPWVKTAAEPDEGTFNAAIADIKSRRFDAAVIFTVYSQNPLPTAMLAYLAGIRKVLAYCRENPYNLITNWVPDKEPYESIKHQVRRDLDLVATVGATTTDENLKLIIDGGLWRRVCEKLTDLGLKINKPWLLLHAGVSEIKRQYPVENWVEAAMRLIQDFDYQVVLTGSSAEKELTDELHSMIGAGSFSAAGIFNLDEFICLVKHAPVMLSVNTGTIHIAAAVGTPVVVLYAQTNPQHTPWNVSNKVLPFAVAEHLRSKNEVVAYVNSQVYSQPISMPTAADIIAAVNDLISLPNSPVPPFHETQNGNRAIAAS